MTIQVTVAKLLRGKEMPEERVELTRGCPHGILSIVGALNHP